MDLTPNDIRNYEFPNQMRGYDKEQVDSFLDQIATILENMKQENLRLSMENDSVKSQLENLKKFEDTIKSTAIDARKNADEMLARTKDESEQMLNEAREKAENLINEQEAKVKEYTQHLERLEHTKTSFVNELRDMISLHLDMVKKVADQEFSFTSESTGAIEVTNSEEVSRQEMTTIASEPQEESIVTEEANAAEEIVSVEKQIAEAEAETSEAAVEEEQPLDPELAAALAGYEHPEPTQEEITPETMIGVKPTPKLGEVVETTMRAEDIPEGFFASESDLVHPDEKEVDTGKMNVEQKVVDEKKAEISPDNIVQELDNVVAKFEEEIEKAEKN